MGEKNQPTKRRTILINNEAWKNSGGSRLTIGSLFDGSGTAPLAATMCGIEPVWASEVEPFPIRVTTKRLPFMKHYGDVTKMHGGEIEPVDIICGGSPCQDLSVAGKRAGLEGGERSVLFHEQIRIIKEMRNATNNIQPRWGIWENVPGAFSSNGGEDFRCVLEAFCHVADESADIPRPKKWASAGCIVGDGWSVAYRTLDAQYWGVAQRRRRIFLVADFRSERAGEILFESEGVPRNFTPSVETGESAAGKIEGGAGESECWGIDAAIMTGGNCTAQGSCVYEDISATLKASAPHGVCCEDKPITLRIRSGCEGGGKGALIQVGKSATPGCNNDQTLIEPICYGICSDGSNSMKSDNPNSGIYIADTSRTLDGNGGNPSCNQGGIAVCEPKVYDARGNGDGEVSCTITGDHQDRITDYTAICIQGSVIGRADKNGPQGSGISEDVSFTLNTMDRHAVLWDGTNIAPALTANNAGGNQRMPDKDNFNAVIQPKVYENNQFGGYREGCGTLKASGGDYGGGSENIAVCRDIVRRLTPTECARLQGFADGWCSNIAIPNPTESDIAFWQSVWDTYQSINGKKPKSVKQIVKWLKHPHSDSAEYKMWGNGMALPCVLYIMQGIREAGEPAGVLQT
jgi:DNA (cytosine-5)-methyltransferase 1